MSSKWYGNVINRILENPKTTPEIVVDMGMTQYFWSDRTAWEVIEVKSQRHVIVRELNHKLIGEPYSNDWELSSNENNRTKELIRPKKYWYEVWRDNEGNIIGKDKVNVSFGHADYYYDYSF